MLQTWHYPVLFCCALTAGFVDSIAGGGGLITLPSLIAVGIDAPMALGTNKLQSSFGSASATRVYLRAGAVDWRKCILGFICTLVGAAAGALTVEHLNPKVLERLIPILLTCIIVILAVRPKFGSAEEKARFSPELFHVIFGLGLGFYDGFFGPGTGTFWTMAYVMGLGLNLTRATGHTKLMNFASNISSLALFIIGGRVYFGVGLLMGLGQFIGGWLGSHLAVRKGANFIRPVLLLVAFAITVKLLVGIFTIKP